MAAEYLLPAPKPLPLLLPPDRPPAGVYRTYGWRWKATGHVPVLERRPQDDEHGALVQWIVLRYYRDGVLRKTLAQEYSYSIRCIQEYLTGAKGHHKVAGWFSAYGAPLRRSLLRVGVPIARYGNEGRRTDRQVEACRAALVAVADLLADDDRPAARRLIRDIRLLTVEPPT